MTLSPKALANLSSIEIGNFAAYPVDPAYGGGWNVCQAYPADAPTLDNFRTLDEAIAWLESKLD